MYKIYKKIILSGMILFFGMLLLAGCGDRAGFYVQQQVSQATEAGNDDPAENVWEDVRSPGEDGGSEGEDAAKGGGTPERGDKEAFTEEAPAPVYVQVCGAVVNPGVYQLPFGSRIFEAVDLAGGPTKEADLSSLNQAEKVSDGQMIYLYAKGEERRMDLDDAKGGTDSQERMDTGSRVNLNTADASQLMTLPGIGQSKAEDIIAWREEHGPFQAIEDIMNVQGIKQGVFDKIKDKIEVGG